MNTLQEKVEILDKLNKAKSIPAVARHCTVAAKAPVHTSSGTQVLQKKIPVDSNMVQEKGVERDLNLWGFMLIKQGGSINLKKRFGLRHIKVAIEQASADKEDFSAENVTKISESINKIIRDIIEFPRKIDGEGFRDIDINKIEYEVITSTSDAITVDDLLELSRFGNEEYQMKIVKRKMHRTDLFWTTYRHQFFYGTFSPC